MIQAGRRHRYPGYIPGLGMVGIVPAMLGIVLSGWCAAGWTEEQVSVSPGATNALVADALVSRAEALRSAGDLAGAQELLRTALQRDPSHAGARSALAVVESQMTGRPQALENEAGERLSGTVRVEAALAEARMLTSRAELIAAGGRFEDAMILLAQARVMLQPYTEQDTVQQEAKHLEELLAAYRERHLATRAADEHGERQDHLMGAEGRARQNIKSAAAQLDVRIAQVEDLDRRDFIESALAACRRLVDEYPENQRIERLYAKLIARSHAQRELSIKEQRDELLQETQERIERSLIPSGFDGWPQYPSDWNDRRTVRGALEAPVALEPWETVINEKLATRLSYNLVEQNALEVLNAFAKQAGVNLIIDPSVFAGGDVVVTLKANDISLRNTLSWICRLANTNWFVDRGAIYVGGKSEAKGTLGIYDVSELLFVPKDQVGKQLAFAAGAVAGGGGGKAGGNAGFNLFAAPKDDMAAPAIAPEDLIDLIQKAVTPDVWKEEGMGISVRGTTLLITAPTATHLLVQQFIRSQENQRSQQVRVNARWLTIKDGYLEEIGVDWRSDRFQNPTANNPTPLQIPNTPPHATLADDQTGFHRFTNQFDSTGSLVNNLPASSVSQTAGGLASTGLNLQAMLINNTLASTVISAVERNAKGEVLESPEVVTMSGVRANTFMGRQYAYIGDYEAAPPAGTLDGTLDPVIGVLNLGAILDIKPFVSADGKYVTMEFRPALASLESVFLETITTQRFIPLGFIPGGNGNGNGVVTGQIQINNFQLELPNVLVREVSTTIMVPDGGTILVGGFGKVIEQQMSTKIPFLGHIPFLGRLFGKRGRYSDRYQLYLLADIHIINYAELEAKL